MENDVDRLRQVLDLAAERGLYLGVVTVGDIKIQIVGKAPSESPRELGPDDGIVPVNDDKVALEKRLRDLRRRSKDTFGVVKSDDVLLSLDGVL